MSKYHTHADELIIESVDGDSDDNGFYISANSSGFYLKKSNIGGAVPKKGDKITIHVYGGSSIRGVDLNGKKLYYFTDAEIDAERKKRAEAYKKEQEERFEKEKDQLDADFDALPEIFQKRIERFRKNKPTFRVEFESYEMFCCKEAVKIANACKTPEKVKEFKELMSYEEQLEFAEIDDGHSGNTFGCACALAYHYLTEKENVAKEHGALAPLVGSKEYGEVPVDKNE